MSSQREERSPVRRDHAQARIVAQPEVAPPRLGHGPVDLDAVDPRARVEVTVRTRDCPAGVADHEHPIGRLPEERRQQQEEVPVAAGEDGVAPPDRVDGDALVQLQDPRAVVLPEHAHVLVRRLGLVEEATRALHRAGRDEQERADGDRDGEPPPAQQEHCGEREERSRPDHRAARAHERDEDERREERPEDAPDRRERVEASRDAARLGHVPECEPDRERRDRTEQRHRHGEHRERREEGARDDPDGHRGEPVQREVERRARDERDRSDRHRRDEDDPPEQLGPRPGVGHAPADPVADRQVEQDQPDHVRPDDGRAAEVRR